MSFADYQDLSVGSRALTQTLNAEKCEIFWKLWRGPVRDHILTCPIKISEALKPAFLPFKSVHSQHVSGCWRNKSLLNPVKTPSQVSVTPGPRQHLPAFSLSTPGPGRRGQSDRFINKIQLPIFPWTFSRPLQSKGLLCENIFLLMNRLIGSETGLLVAVYSWPSFWGSRPGRVCC